MSKRCSITIAAMTMIIFGLSANNAAAEKWKTEAADGPKYFSYIYSRAIAVDSSGNPHMAYGEDHLYYAYHDGGSWQYETVDSAGGVGEYAAIAIDSSDHVHISYYDTTNRDLKYATNASGSWVTEVVGISGENKGSPSIAIDSSDHVHVSYINGYPYNDLKHATYASGSWVTEIVDSAGYVSQGSAIVIDSFDHVHISYSDYTHFALKYATGTPGSWVTETVDSAGSVGEYSSIALDSSGHAHIGYYDATNWDLKYASYVVPTPDIKANGSDGPVVITRSQTLSVTDALNAGHLAGEDADWWLLVNTPLPAPNDWYYGIFVSGAWTWFQGLEVTYQGALIDQPPTEVLNTSGLPAGTYTFYAGVGTIMNGSINLGSMYYDSVVVEITP